MGSYSFFNQGVDIFADNAFEVPRTRPAGSLHNLLTTFLDPKVGEGGILNVVKSIAPEGRRPSRTPMAPSPW